LTRPRKRTLLSVCWLLCGALLAGGTVNSSEAAPRRGKRSKRNHSITVKRQQKSASSKKVTNLRRRAVARARSAAPNARAVKAALARRKALFAARNPSPRPRKQIERVVITRKIIETIDVATQEAVARREEWQEPRRQVLAAAEPVKVQDPPVTASRAPVAEAAEKPAKKRVVMARAAPVSRREDNEDLIREALRNRGTPYVWGGASRGGFDCSGFTMYLFRKERGIKLPHSASAQARRGTPVRRNALQPGDLVFFSTYRRGISHVGVYMGENKFIHAANSRRDVRVDALTGYWGRRYRGARRLTPAPVRISPQDVQDYVRDESQTP
jgi:cell wall-associated NlpC family hydrolase